MRKIDSQYKDLYRFISQQGLRKASRTGIDTESALGGWMRFDLRNELLPITSLRLVRPEKFIGEQLWFVSGNPSIKFLKDNNISIWDNWFIPGTAVYEDELFFRPIFDILQDYFKQNTMPGRLITTEDCKRLESETGLVVFGDLAFCMGLEVGADIEEHNYATGVCELLTEKTQKVIRYVMARKGIELLQKRVMPIPFRSRVAKAREMGLDEGMFAFYDQGGMVHEEKGIYYAELNVILCPDLAGPVDLFQSEVDQLSAWMDERDVPKEAETLPKPVGLQTRLNRIAKEDKHKWQLICNLVEQPDAFKDPITEHVIKPSSIEIYRNGKFEFVELTSLHAAAVWQLLDDLAVPAYKLLDANIGEGGYGPQWRAWQDTQMISVHDTSLRDEYLKQGYVLKGYMTASPDQPEAQDALVMHRTIDQLQNMVDTLKNDPDSRRIIVTAWNPGRTWQAALPPCHLYFQVVSYEKDLRDFEDDFAKLDLTAEYIESIDTTGIDKDDTYTTEVEQKFLAQAKAFAESKGIPTRWLSMGVLMRSWDTPAGGVFNTPQYAVLLRMIAHVTNMDARELFIVGIDAHIYENQKEAIDEVIYTDSPEDFPRLLINRKVENIDDFNLTDFEVVGYKPVMNTKVMPIAR